MRFQELIEHLTFDVFSCFLLNFFTFSANLAIFMFVYGEGIEKRIYI